MNKLAEVATKKTINDIKNDTFFKSKCVDSFFFLIEKYNFESIKTENHRQHSQILFKKKNVFVYVKYEMGVLPSVKLSFNKKDIIINIESLKKYPIHLKIQQNIEKKFISTEAYIVSLGNIWKDNFEEISKEISSSLEELAKKVEIMMQNN